MGCSRKKIPSPIEEVGFPDFFLVKFSPGFPGFLNKSPYFHTDFQKKNSHKYSKSTPFCFLSLDFQENFAKEQVEFQTFCIRNNEILYGGGQNLSGIAKYVQNCNVVMLLLEQLDHELFKA